ncbi:MAG: hypothetical protein JXB62_09640 [Pirellulales bacterium]|nr:hypothetical protein [Pirellulales bacterium]
MSEALREALESKLREELNLIARKLRLRGYRSLKRDRLIAAILDCDEQRVRRCLSVTWWDRFHGHVYGFASVIALLFSVAVVVIGYLAATEPTASIAPLTASDFALRLAIGSYDFSEKDVQQAPKVIPCRGTLGPLFMYFDLVRLDALEDGTTRGASRPRIVYNAERIRFANLDSHPSLGELSGTELRFPVPASLRELGGPETVFDTNLYIRDRWFTDGYRKCESGTVTQSIGDLGAGDSPEPGSG